LFALFLQIRAIAALRSPYQRKKRRETVRFKQTAFGVIAFSLR
jgi:hypothetical protein